VTQLHHHLGTATRYAVDDESSTDTVHALLHAHQTIMLAGAVGRGWEGEAAAVVGNAQYEVQAVQRCGDSDPVRIRMRPGIGDRLAKSRSSDRPAHTQLEFRKRVWPVLRVRPVSL